MQIFYLNEEYKTPHDRIEVQGSEAQIQVWRELPPQASQDRVECAGYQWLLGGRGKRMGHGVDRVFREFPQLQTLELRFVDLEFGTESVDGRGQLRKTVLPRTYLRYRINRQQARPLDGQSQRLKKELDLSLSRCLNVGRRIEMEREIKL